MFQRAFSVSTREPAPCFLRRGDTPPRGCLLHGATLERLCDCVLACRVVSRGHVPLYAIMATSWLWLCRALDVVAVVAVRHVVAVAVVPWPWRPWVWLWRGVAVAVASAVFLSPSCGCDTPMDASVCNGFGVVCVDSICTTYVGRV